MRTVVLLTPSLSNPSNPSNPCDLLFLSHCPRKHVLERRNTRPEMPHLHAMLRCELKQVLCGSAIRNEDTKHVLVRGVALEAHASQRIDETNRVTLDTQLEYPTAVSLQRLNRSLRCHRAFVYDHDMIAGAVDMPQ